MYKKKLDTDVTNHKITNSQKLYNCIVGITQIAKELEIEELDKLANNLNSFYASKFPEVSGALQFIINALGWQYADIMNNKRVLSVVDKRYFVMLILRDYYNCRFTDIANYFSLSHATVIKGCDKVFSLLEIGDTVLCGYMLKFSAAYSNNLNN